MDYYAISMSIVQDFFLPCDLPPLCDNCPCDPYHIYSEILNESRTAHLSREPYGTSLGIGGLGGVSMQWSDPWDDTVHVDISSSVTFYPQVTMCLEIHVGLLCNRHVYSLRYFSPE